MSLFDPAWAVDGIVEAPSDAEVRAGFSCGPANPYVFNWLFQDIQTKLNSLSAGTPVQESREINTTEGIQGGGDLSQDRLIRLNIPGLQAETSIANDDYIVIYDVSDAVHKKMTRSNLIAGLGGEGGSITGADNIGDGGGELFSSLAGDTLEFRTLKAGEGLVVSTVGNNVTVAHADYATSLTVE